MSMAKVGRVVVVVVVKERVSGVRKCRSVECSEETRGKRKRRPASCTLPASPCSGTRSS
jgi:hypothetical protein